MNSIPCENIIRLLVNLEPSVQMVVFVSVCIVIISIALILKELIISFIRLFVRFSEDKLSLVQKQNDNISHSQSRYQNCKEFKDHQEEKFGPPFRD